MCCISVYLTWSVPCAQRKEDQRAMCVEDTGVCVEDTSVCVEDTTKTQICVYVYVSLYAMSRHVL